jgi:hypothetical protein
MAVVLVEKKWVCFEIEVAKDQRLAVLDIGDVHNENDIFTDTG